MKRVFAINFPASAGLAFLGIPIIGLIFEHGRFSQADTLFTSRALAAYAVGLTAYSVVKVLVPICYAIGETKFAVWSSFFSVVSNLIFNFLFVKKLGFVGLALGTSITAILNSALLWWMITRKMHRMGASAHTDQMVRSLSVYLTLALVMGTAVYGFDHLIAPHVGHLVRVAVGMGIGGGSYFGLSSLLKCQESLEFLELFRRRLGKKR